MIGIQCNALDSMALLEQLQARIDEYDDKTYALNVKLNDMKAQQRAIIDEILTIKPLIVPFAQAKSDITKTLTASEPIKNAAHDAARALLNQ